MNFPDSFLGARADALMDIVILSLAIIIPIILYSYRKVKNGEYATHKRIQLWLGIALLIVVIIFEMDMRQHGGIFEMVKGSRFEGTLFLNASIYFHTFLSITTSIIWLILILVSMRKFDKDPVPNSFSKRHKFWGKIGMIDMILTGITGVQLYICGFIL